MSLDVRERTASIDVFSDPTAPVDRRDQQILLTGTKSYRIASRDYCFALDEYPPTRLRPLIESIVSLCALPANWDSYGARPVDPWRAAAAIALLLDIVTSDTPLPSVVPTNRGGLQLEWHCSNVDLEIEITSPTKCMVEFEDFRTGKTESLVLTGNLEPLDPLLKRLSQVN